MKQPYDDKGHFVSRECPNPDCDGTLQYEVDPLTKVGIWRCDGLVDPNDPNKELEACDFSHTDGEPYTATPEQFVAHAAATCRCHPGW